MKLKLQALGTKEIGVWVKQRRIEKDWTAERLALETKRSRMTIYNIEKGNHRPLERTLDVIEKALSF